MNIAWSPEAIEDLVSLRAYIAEDNPAAAERVVLHIVQNIEQLLPDNPNIGRAGRVPGTREFVIPRTPYIVPIGSSAAQSRFYASIMGHGVGPTDFDRPAWDQESFCGLHVFRIRNRPCVGSVHFFDFSFSGFRSRTPGPPPFSSMNSTPTSSNARLSTVIA
jgi:toxin ParE1/3/4